jgi:hypothetical protein
MSKKVKEYFGIFKEMSLIEKKYKKSGSLNFNRIFNILADNNSKAFL